MSNEGIRPLSVLPVDAINPSTLKNYKLLINPAFIVMIYSATVTHEDKTTELICVETIKDKFYLTEDGFKRMFSGTTA